MGKTVVEKKLNVKTLIDEGWSYYDLPRMTNACLDSFMEIAGGDNIVFLTFADYGQDTVRGQIYISPDGIRRMRKHIGRE